MTQQRREFLKQLGVGGAALSMAGSLPLRLLAKEPTRREMLLRGTPEAHGVSSPHILEFLDEWTAGQDVLCSQPHSFMLLRHGHVLAEAWWAPYKSTELHILHSLSKSFTSTAIGFLVSEGKLKVEDAVAQFFPDELPPSMSENLVALRIKHLLTMSVGRGDIPETSVPAQHDWDLIPEHDDWIRAYLALPIDRPPGSFFRYDSFATYMLSAIVQKRSGEKLIDYLKPRFFEPLDIHGMTWDTSPEGINTGGWGLSATTETIAKLGQFYLQGGRWNEKQLLPRAWIQEATTFKIQQPSTPDVDWRQGYCYQFWRCRHNAYRGDGAWGQYCVVMPDQDAVVAITSESDDEQAVLDLVWKHLLPAFSQSVLPKDSAAEGRLLQRLAALSLPLPKGSLRSPRTESVTGKVTALEPNSLGAQNLSFVFGDDACSFLLEHAGGTSEVHCGMGKWLEGVTTMPGVPPAINLAPLTEPPGPVKVAAAAAWQDTNTLEMQWHYCERGHRDTVVCRFDDNHVSVEFSGELDERPTLKGRLS